MFLSMVMKGRAGWSRVFDEGRPIVKKSRTWGHRTWPGKTHGVVDFDFLFRYGIFVKNGLLDIVFV